MLPWVLLFLSVLLYSLLLSFLAGSVKPLSRQGEALQRKVFHVGIFTGALPAQYFMGFWGVVLYGGTVGGLILLSTMRARRSFLFRVLDRAAGKEGRAGILVPLVATALGGLLGVLLVGRMAMVGYLVCGWGDAAGEIVGRRWGRHHYGPLLPSWIRSNRSLEGSLGVFLMGSAGGWAALGILGFPPAPAIGVGLVVGGAAALAEGLSRKGTDNFWLQLLPSLLAWWILG